IAIDRPGFGHSTRPRSRVWTPAAQAKLIAMALDQLHIENPLVLGHSLGTLTAMELSRIRPLKGLALVSGYYYPTPRVDQVVSTGSALPILGDIMAYTISPLVGLMIWPRISAKIFSPRPVPSRFKKAYPKGLSLRPSQLKASAEDLAMMNMAVSKLSDYYGRFSCPVVAIHGDGDEILEPEQAGKLHRQHPNIALTRESGIGHMAHYAEPQRILAAIGKLVVPAIAPDSAPKLAPTALEGAAEAGPARVR
ncbi:MAG TPA: alpha/beta hydrolase, partial [Aestuariivirgaceae bacterium]|nr:alpha/beta hydrolase [Aestuariivirgaceae bacterium]